MNFDFSLNEWAKEGILLLNLALTARKNGPHYKQWKRFIKVVINEINAIPGLIIVLWGTKLQKLAPYFSEHHHLIVEEHPSYTERRNIVDWKTNTFTEINRILAENNNETIIF
jgi:uracil DNA glycosylase